MIFGRLKSSHSHFSRSLLFKLASLLFLFSLSLFARQAHAAECSPGYNGGVGQYIFCIDISSSSGSYGEGVSARAWVDVPCAGGGIACRNQHEAIGFSVTSAKPSNQYRYLYNSNATFLQLLKGGTDVAGQVLKQGKYRLTAHTFYGQSPTVEFTITEQRTSVKLTPSKLSVKIGEQFSLKAETTTYGATGISLLSYGSNPGETNQLLAESAITQSGYGWSEEFKLAMYEAGEYAFRSTFEPNDPNYSLGDSGKVIVTVTRADTNVSLSFGSPGPYYVRKPVTLVAKVGGDVIPRTGIVNFYIDHATLIGTAPVVDGVAVLQYLPETRISNSPLKAEFVGDNIYNGSVTTDAPSLYVGPFSPKVTLTALETTAPFGKGLRFQVKVEGIRPSGKVSLGTTHLELVSAFLNADGTAEFIAFPDIGINNMGVFYHGDVANNPEGSNSIDVKITPAASVIDLAASPATGATPGSQVVLMAKLEGDRRYLSGTVSFYDREEFLGSQSVAGNDVVFSTTNLKAVGDHSISAKYSGNTWYSPATSAPINIKIELAKSEVSLTSSANPLINGNPVSISAEVKGVDPTGKVSFYEKDKLLAEVNLEGGVARLDTSLIRGVGVHEIKAVYAGDSQNLPATSAVFQQTVKFNPAHLTPILQLLLN